MEYHIEQKYSDYRDDCGSARFDVRYPATMMELQWLLLGALRRKKQPSLHLYAPGITLLFEYSAVYGMHSTPSTRTDLI
jgi:hypothetical protein